VQNINLKKFFLYLLIASVGVSALIGIGVILIGTFGEFEQKVLATTFTIIGTSILGLVCGAYLETGRGKVIPIAGIAISLTAAVLWLILIWYGTVQDKSFAKTVMTATLLAAACSHISLLSLARLERRFLWFRYAGHGAVWTLAAFVLCLIWNVFNPDEDINGRVVGVLAIIVAAFTVITPIFHKLSSGETSAADIDAEIEKLRSRIDELKAKKAVLTESYQPAAADQV
jgi:hypothetical protein